MLIEQGSNDLSDLFAKKDYEAFKVKFKQLYKRAREEEQLLLIRRLMTRWRSKHLMCILDDLK